MRNLPVMFCLLLASTALQAAPPSPTTAPAPWKAKVTDAMPLLGHRNWILIVDSAYPLQTSPGVETIETNATQPEVIQYVLGAITSSVHVRPAVFMDSELAFVPEDDAPGAAAYRAQIDRLLSGYSIESLLHEKIIANIDEAGKLFHVLVLKTTLAVPYTSVFIRLDCKYWSADAEARLRSKMAEAPLPAAH